MKVTSIERKDLGKRGTKITVQTTAGAFSRESLNKKYSHVVIYRRHLPGWRDWDGTEHPARQIWETSWASRADLAESAARTTRNRHGSDILELYVIALNQEEN